MKKFTLLIALMLFAIMGSYAQASLYTFAQSNGTYVPITGGTVVTSSTSGTPNLDSYTSSQQALPAPFVFAGTTYNNFYVTSNGQVALGTTTVSNTEYRVLSNGTGGNVFLAPLSADLEEGANGLAEIRYEMVGDEIIIQWTNFRRYNKTESFNMQVRMNTVNRDIKFVYDGTPPYASSTDYQPQVGIKSAAGAYSALTVATDVSWNTPTVITTGITSSSIAVLNGATGFTSGLTYTWSAPPACSGTPVAGTVTGNLVRNICVGGTPAAIAVTGASSTTIPGISYQWEQSLNGTDWENVTAGTGATTLSYTPPAFDGTTIQYRLKVMCSNSSETVYADAVTIDNQAAPTTQATAATATPANTFPTSFSMSWTSGNGGRRMVIVSDAAIADPTNTVDVPAIVASNIYAGTGQQIVYDGTGTSVTVYGLSCETSYFVKVYEYNRCGSADVYSYYYNTSADTNAITVTTGSIATAALPVSNNFSGFTGSNLLTAVPGWTEANIPTVGGSTPSTTNPGNITSAWGNSSVFGVTTARVNLYTNTRNEWIISPAMEITADSRLIFDAAITNYSSGAADSDRMQGTDDVVNVMVSTDGCGVEWTPVYTFNAANTTTLTNALVEYQVLLTDYIGQTIQVAFQAVDGPIDNGPDYDFHVGNIIIEEVPACDTPTLLATTEITKNSATIAWTAPEIGTPTGYEYVVSETNETPTVADDTTTELSADITSLNPSTDYYVFVRTICGTDGNSEWTVAGEFTTLCDYPEILTTDAGEVCGQGEVLLEATATGGEIHWYSAPTGGSLLASGAEFTTPLITESTSYYVQATDPIVSNVGATYTGTSNNGTSTGSHGIMITTTEPNVVINSADIPFTGTGTFTIALKNTSNSTVITSVTTESVSGSGATAVTVPINLTIANPGSYLLIVNSISGSIGGLGYSTGTYPYTSDGGTFAITNGYWYGSTASNMYFYNLSVTTGCSSPRQEVIAVVTDAPEVEATATEVEICAGESTELSVTSDNTDYTYNWMPGNLDGATQTVTPDATTDYVVTATDAVSGCVTTRTVTVTVNPLPSTVVVSPSPVTACIDAVQSLEVTGGILGGEATVGNGTDITGTTEELTVFCNRRATHKSQTIYTAADLNALGLGAGAIISIAYNVDSIGSSANNSNFTVKMGTTSLNSFPDTSYIDESGFVTVFAPATYTHVVGVNTITFTTPFEWDGVSNIVISISQSGVDSLYNAQTYYTTMGSNVTLYNYDDLAATTGTASAKRFNVTFAIEGSTEITWSPVTNLYTDADATVAYTEGTDATVVYFKSGVEVSETYTVTSTSAAGCSVSSTVDVNVSIIDAPTVDNTDVTLCNGITVADLMANGDDIQWYAAATGGEPLDTDMAVANGTYYASQTVNGCESMTRTALNVTLYVMETPEVTVVHPGCAETTGSITFTAPLGDNFVYSIDGGANFQASPEFLALNPGDYELVVKNNDNDCTVALEVTTVNPAPAVPAVASVTVVQPFCEVITGTITVTSPVGDEFEYSINGTDFQDSPIFADLEPGVYTVTVMNESGCTSVSEEITIVPAAVVDAPTVDNANVTICNAGTVAELAANGDNIQWYADETGGEPLADDAALTDGTYYASQTVDGCESATRTAVTVTVNVVAAPIVDNADVTICNAGTVAELAANGDNIQWYADETGGEPLADDTALVNGTYYASQTIDGCESVARVALTVTVNVVAAPTGDANQTISVENPADATIEDIEVTVADGAVLTWYASEEDAIAGENPIAEGTVLTNGTTYYATQTVDGCEGDAVLAVTVGVVLGRDDFNIKAFSYYPNPVQDVLNLSYDKEITSVAVFNLLGQQVMAKTPNATDVKLDMSVLSDGTYLVSVTAGDTVKTIKVVKKQ